MPYRDQLQAALESETGQASQTRILRALAKEEPALQGFPTIGDLRALLRSRTPDYPRRDAALLALVRAHQANCAAGAFDILTAMMFPVLDGMYRGQVRGRKAKEHDAIWSQMVAAFASALDSYPIVARRRRVAGNLHRETYSAFLDSVDADREYYAEMKRIGREVRRFLSSRGQLVPDPIRSFFEFEEAEAVEPDPEQLREAESVLGRYFEAGFINSADRDLLTRALVERKTALAIARELDSTHTAVRKRIQRARERIRKRFAFPEDE